MFSLQHTPIDPAALKRAMESRVAGACVTFEGWVRDHNEGRAVSWLEYDAYPALAVKEGNRILDEASRRWPVTMIAAVHRVGRLEIGDCAVWVGVSAPHRGEAFHACRGIIDEIKHRVPIWKRERYVDGTSGWVNCEGCAHPHGRAVTERAYYERQVMLPEVGTGGQQALRNARALVVGMGGLGCPAAQYLTAAGVGAITLCDGDRVEPSNLHRQPLFGAEDVGRPKAHRAAERLRALNPFVRVEALDCAVDDANVDAVVSSHDIVLECTDSQETKLLVSAAAVRTGTTAVIGGIYQYEGQVLVVRGREGPCLRCLWPDPPAADCVGSCAEVGVLGVVPGVIGTMQAAEALKTLLQLPGCLHDALLTYDALAQVTRRIRIPKRAECPVCGGLSNASVRSRPAEFDTATVEVDARTAASSAWREAVFVDLGELHDGTVWPASLPDPVRLPWSAFPFDSPPFAPDRRYVLCCAYGRRSRFLALSLRERGYALTYSLKGGLLAMRADSKSNGPSTGR